MKAEQVKEKILKAKGNFVSAKWKSNPKPCGQFKHLCLEKVSRAVIRAGVDYANLAENEGKEIGPLPWGEWVDFPRILQHKGELYLRLYPSKSPNHRVESQYYVNGNEIDRATFLSYLTPSDAKKQDEIPPCFNIKEENLLDVNEDN